MTTTAARWKRDNRFGHHILWLEQVDSRRPTRGLNATVSMRPVGRIRMCYVSATYLCDEGRYDLKAQTAIASGVADCKAWCERTVEMAQEWLDGMEERFGGSKS